MAGKRVVQWCHQDAGCSDMVQQATWIHWHGRHRRAGLAHWRNSAMEPLQEQRAIASGQEVREHKTGQSIGQWALHGVEGHLAGPLGGLGAGDSYLSAASTTTNSNACASTSNSTSNVNSANVNSSSKASTSKANSASAYRSSPARTCACSPLDREMGATSASARGTSSGSTSSSR